MEIRQFKQFVAVAEELNFRRAAERLRMAQPPLTAAIKKLEDELGTILLERSNRVTRLTAAGEVFLDEARRTLHQIDNTIRVTKRAGAGLAGSLRVSFVASASHDLLQRVVLAFRKHHSDVELELLEATTVQQIRLLREGRTDVGFVVPPIRDAEDLTIESLAEDRLVAVLPGGHPLAKRRRLNLSDLAEDPWIMFPAHQGPGLHAQIMASCAQAGFTPNIRQEAIQMGTIVNLVACGIGVALVPSSLKSSMKGRVTFSEVSGPGTPVRYSRALAYKASSPVLDTFIRTVRECVS